MSSYNHRISIKEPFDVSELPALFCWIERIRGTVTDEFPTEINSFMDYQLERVADPAILTYGIYKDGDVGGYFEAITQALMDVPIISTTLQKIAQAQCFFKKEIWGLERTRPSLNLCLQKLFESDIETVFFPILAHNRALMDLFRSVGMTNIGLVEPKTQRGNPIATEMFCVSRLEWEKRNRDFLEIFEKEQEKLVISEELKVRRLIEIEA